MRYKSFRIRNFKGIKDTTIHLDGLTGANVFAFVGLNESGKTTVLEAIHSFSPDEATSELIEGDYEGDVPFDERVPRHLISSFTGDVSVTATLVLSQKDKLAIAESFLSELALTVDTDSLGPEIIFERIQRFKDGDFQNSYFSLRSQIRVRKSKQQKWRDPNDSEKLKVRNLIYRFTPDIAYFPTFVFDFPEAIFLTERGGAIDGFYRRVFQDVLDQDGRGHTIQKDIVRRIRNEHLVTDWLTFLTSWGKNDEREKIQHVMDRASAAVTQLVFSRWNKIFGEDARGKEVVISYDVVEGEKEDDQGNTTKSNEHDISIKFEIKDGSRRFNVNDRSLGFRWFFAFMLFTQFRVARFKSRPVLFLFDEPASNLHAAAQQKLIECFPEIARDDHMLAYSTHSHYMIEPKWLEQTYIVTNRSDAPTSSILAEISLDDESLDIKVASYRSFVNQHPHQTSYFQPILDRLEVVPSRFDIQKASIILEGRSDYYILRYASKALGITDLPLLPALGAGTFGALAALHVGWNLKFFFLLDGDHQGRSDRAKYVTEYGIPSDRTAILTELVAGITVIEDLLDDVALEFVRNELNLTSKPSKAQIRRFFQEHLASNKIQTLSPTFGARSTELLETLKQRLNG